MNAAENIAMEQDTAIDEQTRQFLTFLLAEEEYGVDILRVQEVKGWTPVTCIPQSPEYVRGVLNLRGTIVPIIDLRMRFNIDTVEYTRTTVIIVISVESEDSDRVIGVVADGVSDVIDVVQEKIKSAPDFGTKVHTDFISGLATIDEKMIMLLDIDKLLTADEIKGLDTLV
ncbi:MAG: chemotaxis protein CheW [Gammaproteobacteria bacterium]|nr:MAG: chemotaxis protein CheW [Gammaproteobacteria bacterium]